MSETKLVIELPIYESVRSSQLQHGLKYDDQRQYRSYCSRRLHRLRRSLNVHQNIPSTAKARHQRAKKLIDINNIMVLEAGEKNDDYANRMLIIPLCLAERAWSYAMQLKQEIAEYPRKRFHLVRRLKRAAEYASRFEKLVHDSESPCSDRTKKEATAYAAYMNGLYNMEREQWVEAKENFNNSLMLYSTLSLSIESQTMVEQYRLRIEELRASLRYCTFTLGEKPQEPKFQLPATLKFNDIAFKHAKQIQKQLAAKPAVVSSRKEEQKPVDKSPAPKTPATSAKETQKVQQKSSPQQKQSVTKQKEQQKTQQKQQPKPAEDEEEEEEFEEAVDAGEGDMSVDETSSEEEEPQPAGGVTGLVKGWLGGAWR